MFLALLFLVVAAVLAKGDAWADAWSGLTGFPLRGCRCSKVLQPVCKGHLTWPNDCMARCEGMVDATPC
jgi:hypothetical protein